MSKIVVLEVVIGGNGIIQPSQLKSLLSAIESAIPAGGTESIVISGRLPVWVYGALVHFFHPRPYVGTFEPRLMKAVIVANHIADVNVGDLVDVADAEKVTITFGGGE